jgi:phosphoketolase
LRSLHYVNVVVAGKHPAPQWLTMDAAVKHCTAGIGIWQWASNDQGLAPDVVLVDCYSEFITFTIGFKDKICVRCTKTLSS